MARACPTCDGQFGDEVEACPDDGALLVDPLIGATLGSYKVQKQIGRGGMGGVYLAEHPVIRSRVAIKVMHDKYSKDEKSVDRFYNEARAVNVIGHDNVLKILDLNKTATGRPYFVMEFLDGRSLQALVDKQQPVPLGVAGPIILQICAALQAAHEKGIVHRDLKPENIYLITVRGQKNFVKVVDFGIARLTDSQGQSAGQTRTGMVMGTPSYMSPEQGSGATRQIDARSDIYSLGIIMFQLATGHLPFRGRSFGELLAAHLQQPPPRPQDFNSEVIDDYQAIILQALEKKQEDRFQSMLELAARVRHVLLEERLPLVAPNSNPASVRSKRPIALDGTIPDGMMMLGDAGMEEAPLLATVAHEEMNPTVQHVDGLGSNTVPLSRTPTGPPRAPTTPPSGGRPNSGRANQQPNSLRARPASGRAQGPNSGRHAAQEGQQQTSEAAPSSRRWLIIGGAVAVCVAVGLFFALRSDPDEQLASSRNTARSARQNSKAGQAAMAAQAAAKDPSVTITTEPAGAHVTATWQPGDGSAQGESPLVFQAPPESKIELSINLDGYSSRLERITLGQADQQVPYSLSPLSNIGARKSKSKTRVVADPGSPPGDDAKSGLLNPFQ